MEKSCPVCNASVNVPSMDDLKRLGGDRHPEFDDWQKLAYAAEHAEEPFHGVCHGCGYSDVKVIVPIELAALVERHLDNDSPLDITPLCIGTKLSGGTETWKTIVFPLMFCDSCYSSFRWSFWKGTALHAGLIAVISIFAFFAFSIALPLGRLGIVFVIFLLIRLKRHWKKDYRYAAWFSKMPIVQNVLAKESEHRLRRLAAQRRD